MMKNRRILAFAAFLPALAAAQEQAPPNIIFIIADDLGKGDLSCYGNPVVNTPNIDALGQNGVQLERYRCAAPISGPSRVSVLTGRYHYRSGHRMTHVEKTSSLDEPWLARQLAANGYRTAAIGKWHLGDNDFAGRGFDHWVITSPGGWSDFYDYPIMRPGQNRGRSDGKTYATDFLTDEAVKFISSTASTPSKPLFLYLAYNAPHFPLQAPDEEVAPFRNRGLAAGTEILYGMVVRMDKGIGRIVEALKSKGMYDNTIIVFTSDNGPVLGSYQGLSQARWNCGLAGQKENMLEGGINVPCVVQWPARIRPHGEPFAASMHAVDWAPTLMAAAGAKPAGKAFDGVDYLPALESRAEAPGFVRMWCYNKAYPTDLSNAAVINGDWKLHRPLISDLNRWNNAGSVPENITPAPWQLFNLGTDPGEKSDLAAQHPDRVKEMVRHFEVWWREQLLQNEAISGPAK